MNQLSLTILGTGAARPWLGAPASAIFLSAGNNQVLVDCGEGTLLHLPGTAFGDRGLDVVAITHLHGDHLYGLPGLLTSMSLAGRKRELIVVGPQNLREYLSDVFRWSYANLGFSLSFTVLNTDAQAEDLVVELPHLQIRAAPLRHRVESFGYLIETLDRGRRLRAGVVDELHVPYNAIPALRAGEDWRDAHGRVYANTTLTLPAWPQRRVAYLTDTAPLDSWPTGWAAPDILLHDATFAEEHTSLAEQTGHSTVLGAAAFAKTCHAGELLLTHRSHRYSTLDNLLVGIDSIFPQTRWAQAGETIIL